MAQETILKFQSFFWAGLETLEPEHRRVEAMYPQSFLNIFLPSSTVQSGQRELSTPQRLPWQLFSLTNVYIVYVEGLVTVIPGFS